MNINEVSDFFKNLLSETSKKSEMKVYENFNGILSALKKHGLTEEEMQSIERKLGKLKLKENPENRKRHLKQKHAEFEDYLKDKFSLIRKGYYTTIGITFGPGAGMILGMIFLNSFDRSVGMTYGMIGGSFLGLVIGHYMDSIAEKQDRVLKF